MKHIRIDLNSILYDKYFHTLNVNICKDKYLLYYSHAYHNMNIKTINFAIDPHFKKVLISLVDGHEKNSN